MMKVAGRGLFALVLPFLYVTAASAQTRAGSDLPAMGSFGASLTVAGGEVLVGEAGNVMRPGLVYRYHKEGGRWVAAGQLKAADATDADGFGASLAMDGDLLLVGAISQNGGKGAVYAFRHEGMGWRQVGSFSASDAAEGDGFGSAVALSGDLALVSAPAQGKRKGAVYAFRRSADGTWRQQAKITRADGEEGDAFGSSLAVSGARLLISAPARKQQAGAVYAYEDGGVAGWREVGELAVPGGTERRDLFGLGVVLMDDRALVSSPGFAAGAGTVFVFQWNAQRNAWAVENRLFPFVAGRREAFGTAIAVDGSHAWVGAPQSGNGQGAVYVMGPEGDGMADMRARRLVSSAPTGSLGGRVAVHGDVAAASRLGADFGAGSVAIFERDADGTWHESSTLASPPETYASVTGKEVRCAQGMSAQFQCGDVDMLSFLSVQDLGGARGIHMNDNWGWTDPETGKEYVLAGRMDGTAFVDISDPLHPVYLGNLPMTPGAHASFWRDIKTYKNYAFIVSDGAGDHGMQVFDLTQLRNVRNAPVEFKEAAHYDKIHSAHNIVINEETGFAYSVGSSSGGETCGGGLHMIDIRNPTKPKFAGCFADPKTGRSNTGYTHDAQCTVYHGPDQKYQGHEICMGSNETALSIADVTDKSKPVALSRVSYPNVGYTHQGWFTGDQRYFFMDDELDELNGGVDHTRTLIWDVADLSDPQLVGQFMGTTQASDHNLYIKGDLMYQSDYQAGLRIIDISNPLKPTEVGYFDTVPYGTNTPGFGGSWSNYPFFKSGVIAVTSGAEGLFLVKKRDHKPVS